MTKSEHERRNNKYDRMKQFDNYLKLIRGCIVQLSGKARSCIKFTYINIT